MSKCAPQKRVGTLAQWRAYGCDLHGLLYDPAALFVNPGADNYHLKSTSPSINAGTTLTDVTDDVEGYPRTAGSYDVGCYGYHRGRVLRKSGADAAGGGLL
jgi:hypothetical protein